MEHARESLLHDPLTGKPYTHMGLCAPTSAFKRLGEDAYQYMSMLQECAAVALVCTVISAIPMSINSSSPLAEQLSSPWGMTSIGAAASVTWGHVLTDIAMTVFFALFVHRQQRRTIIFDKAGAVASRTHSTSSGKQIVARLTSMVKRDILHQHDQEEEEATRRRASRQEGRRVSSMEGASGRASAGSDTPLASTSSVGSSTTSTSSSRVLRFQQADALPSPNSERSEGDGGGGGEPSKRARSKQGDGPPPKLFRSFKAQGTARTMANVGEACSLVLFGLRGSSKDGSSGGGGAEEEAGLLDAAVEEIKAAGGTPLAVQQPPPCAELTELLGEYQQLSIRKQFLQEKLKKFETKEDAAARATRAAAAAAATAEESSSGGMMSPRRRLSSFSFKLLGGAGLFTPMRFASLRNFGSVGLRRKSSVAQVAPAGDATSNDGNGGGGGGGSKRSLLKATSDLAKVRLKIGTLGVRLSALEAAQSASNPPLLPLAFITLSSVREARMLMNKFKAGALFHQPGGDPRLKRLRLSPAPNPSDIRWANLEYGESQRCRRQLRGWLLMIPILLTASAMVTLGTYASTALKAAPFFTYVPPGEELTAFVLIKNILHFVWCTVLIIGGFQLVIQPTLWIATDGGPCCSRFREMTTSYTVSCLHLMLRVLVFQVIAALFSALIMASPHLNVPFFFGGTEPLCAISPYNSTDATATAACEREGWSPSRCWVLHVSNCWYELGGSVVTNTIIGDSILINLVIDGLAKPDYLVPIYCIARSAPTQALMNELCRITNVLFLPFRTQLFVKTLTLTLLFSTAMPSLYPLLLLFCLTAVPMDRLNLLCRFEPPPLTNALTLRYVVSVWLPACLILHVVLGFGLLCLKELTATPTHALGAALSNPALVTYLVFSLLFVAFELWHVWSSERFALNAGVLTPLHLCRAPCQADKEFRLAGMAATEQVAGLAITMPDKATAEKLYKPPKVASAVVQVAAGVAKPGAHAAADAGEEDDALAPHPFMLRQARSRSATASKLQSAAAKLSAASKLSAFASAPPSMRGDSASSEEEHIQAEPERPPDVDVEKGSS